MQLEDRYNEELNEYIYDKTKSKEFKKIWHVIKMNDEVLYNSILKLENKQSENNIICFLMLKDYKNINPMIYNKLIDLVFSNKEIARYSLKKNINGRESLLSTALQNNGLKLTSGQKEFLIKEANNKIGTTYKEKEKDKLINEVNKLEIDDVYKKEIIYELMLRLYETSEKTHGVFPYDIRYQILKSNLFTIDEKKSLVYDFYHDKNLWYGVLEAFELKALDNPINYGKDGNYIIDSSTMYKCSYDDMINTLDNKDINKMYEEISFCQLMNKLRPKKASKTKKLIYDNIIIY